MDIKPYSQYDETQILPLYRAVGWSNYYNRPEMLKQAFAGSLCTLAAWENGRLIGLIRAVGDGVTIVFIQDILVHPAYQRRGIGRALIARMLECYDHVRQIHLLTDDVPETVGFYKAVGFTPVEHIHAKAFTRLKY